MSSYIPTSENGRESAAMVYLREPLPESYSSESPILPRNVMMYMNFSSASAEEYSRQQGNSVLNVEFHDSSVVAYQEFPSNVSWRDGTRNHEICSQTAQGLSLSLGSHIPPAAGINFHSSDYINRNMGFLSFFNPNTNKPTSSECVMAGYGIGNVSRGITDSKYLKSAQQLLDEVVNVGKALKRHNSRKEFMDDLKGINDGSNNEISFVEKQDFLNKMTKLISMLSEVDRRYKQYYHEMQIVVSAFDVISGCGAAKPYTGLALETISRHFRCLRDAINGQIKANHRSLGENSKGVGISRLGFVDQQQLRQQRTLGMMQQQTWRPQRGLPENSVTLLRAWLFEHFLHPYPKDSDKIMLARQTGLTRGQVSNWFINARVRLWKPMVEEMYKEEAGDAEIESNSSPEIAPNNKNLNKKTSEEDINQSSPASAFDSKSSYQMPPRFENINGGGGDVSLTLGLQHSEDGSLPPMASIGSHQHIFVDNGEGSSMGLETVDFDCVDSDNRKQRFGHLLRDFVA